jgi:hypothetical protein
VLIFIVHVDRVGWLFHFVKYRGNFEDNFFNTMCYVERRTRTHLFVSITVSRLGYLKYGADLSLLLQFVLSIAA